MLSSKSNKQRSIVDTRLAIGCISRGSLLGWRLNGETTGRKALVSCVLSLLGPTCLEAQNAPGYHLAAKYAVGGDPGWDYISLDSGARRLYVSHVSGLEVLDADSGKLVGHIAGTPGVHGIALAPELGKGFVGNGKIDTVSVIDLKTLAHIGELKAGKKPDAIV